MMQHHFESIFGVPLAVVLTSSPWWFPSFTQAIEEYNWFSGRFILPTIGIIVGLLNVWYMIRKHKKL